MIDAIVAAGVAPEDVQTSDLSVQPQYDASGGPFIGGNVTGYRATNSVRIVVRDLDKASSVLDAGIAAGGNAARSATSPSPSTTTLSFWPTLAPGPSRTRRTVPSSTRICPVRRSKTS